MVGLPASALTYAGLTRFNERRAHALGLATE
jgi:hypothetical protein